LFQLGDCVLGFEHLKALHAKDEDFGDLVVECSEHPKAYFLSRVNGCVHQGVAQESS